MVTTAADVDDPLIMAVASRASVSYEMAQSAWITFTNFLERLLSQGKCARIVDMRSFLNWSPNTVLRLTASPPDGYRRFLTTSTRIETPYGVVLDIVVGDSFTGPVDRGFNPDAGEVTTSHHVLSSMAPGVNETVARALVGAIAIEVCSPSRAVPINLSTFGVFVPRPVDRTAESPRHVASPAAAKLMAEKGLSGGFDARGDTLGVSGEYRQSKRDERPLGTGSAGSTRYTQARTRDESEKKESFRRVTLYFGTDRNYVPSSNSPSQRFGSDRVGKVSYGRCEVSIPMKHRTGELEGPFFSGAQSLDPECHIALVDIELLTRGAFFKQVANKRLPSATRKALIFIHGFNNSFQDAARRAAQIVYDVGFVGVPFFYSWPSNGLLKDYRKDSGQAEQAIVHVKEFVRALSTDGNSDSVSIIAHSMGSRLLTRAFLSLKHELKVDQFKQFKEIILAAPDIDADVFRKEIAPPLIESPTVLTLYASSRDVALSYSKQYNGAPRAGESGKNLILLPGMETIDATNVDTSLFFGMRHSYFADSWEMLSDLYYLLEMELRAKKRFALESVKVPPALEYWRFRR